MSAQTHMLIAGVHFTIRCPEITVFPDPWPCYRSFEASARPPAGADTVDLEVCVGKVPRLSEADLLFNGESWFLYRGDGDTRCIALAPRSAGTGPAWVACMDASFQSGRVYCDEALVQDNDGVIGIFNPILHRLDQLIVMYVLSMRTGVLIHAAGVVIGGAGYVFGGASGAGKSTLSRLLLEDRKKRFNLLSDDRVAVREVDGEFRVFGTPWAGDAQIGMNASAPLHSLLFLEKSESPGRTKIRETEAFERLMPLVSIAWYDPDMVSRMTDVCGRLAETIRAQQLCFYPDEGIVDFLGERLGVNDA